MGKRCKRLLFIGKEIHPMLKTVLAASFIWLTVVGISFLSQYLLSTDQTVSYSVPDQIRTLVFGTTIILVMSMLHLIPSFPALFKQRWFLIHLLLGGITFFIYQEISMTKIVLPQPGMVFFQKASSFANPTLNEIFGNGFGLYSINLFIFSMVWKKQIPTAPSKAVIKNDQQSSTTATDHSYLADIKVKVANRTYFVSTTSILFIKSSNNYSELYTKEGKHVIRESLRNLEANLDPNLFIRIHRSVIVKVEEVVEFLSSGNGDYKIRLKNDQLFNVGNKYKRNVIAMFKL